MRYNDENKNETKRREIGMDIVVLAGGLSAERDVSFQTGAMVAKALRENGHRVILTDVFMGYQNREEDVSEIFSHSLEASVTVTEISESAPDPAEIKAKRADQSDCFFGPNVIAMCRMADIVFLALHGEDGENGKIQAAFDLFGIRYTGSGYFGSALAMDKEISKEFFRKAGVPVPNGVKIKKSEREKNAFCSDIAFPCVVKPLCGGSSIGVSIVRTKEEFAKALDEAFRWEDEALVEEYIIGREFSVGVLGETVLPVIEMAPVQGFYDYKNKYQSGSTVETCPADIPAAQAERMQKYAMAAASSLGLMAYARMDFLLNDAGEIFCLEANTLPGMTVTSLIPQEAQAAGIGFNELCERIIRISLQKYEG